MNTQQSSRTSVVMAYALLVYLSVLLLFVVLALQYRVEVETAQIEPPPDFREITVASERKQAFFDFMRTIVAKENLYYTRERERLLAVAAKLDAGKGLSRRDRRKLDNWTEIFGLNEELTPEEKIKILQRRINTLPEAMVLAQAAIESAWGRSRFALEGNNYFGQWCYTPGCGLTPERRDTNASHEVRKFDSVSDAVRAYFININTHRAYRALRDERLALEEAGEKVTGSILVGHLTQYSQRGQHYVNELRTIIQGNELE